MARNDLHFNDMDYTDGIFATVTGNGLTVHMRETGYPEEAPYAFEVLVLDENDCWYWHEMHTTMSEAIRDALSWTVQG